VATDLWAYPKPALFRTIPHAATDGDRFPTFWAGGSSASVRSQPLHPTSIPTRLGMHWTFKETPAVSDGLNSIEIYLGFTSEDEADFLKKFNI
jgi:hypothetical protein